MSTNYAKNVNEIYFRLQFRLHPLPPLSLTFRSFVNEVNEISRHFHAYARART